MTGEHGLTRKEDRAETESEIAQGESSTKQIRL